MRFIITGILFTGLISFGHAGMMGHGPHMGMMNNATPAAPPPKTASPATRKGYELTRHYCIQCHAPPNPAQHTAAQWPVVMARMQKYMQQLNRPQPDAAEQKLILQYLESGTAGNAQN